MSDVSEMEVAEALDLQVVSDPGDVDREYETADGQCRVYQILIGQDEVQFYADAGGNVATNDDETLGARVNPCLR